MAISDLCAQPGYSEEPGCCGMHLAAARLLQQPGCYGELSPVQKKCFFSRTQRGLAMRQVIMIGCDLHDATVVLKVADGPGPSVRKGFATANRTGMIGWLKQYVARRGAERSVFAYEASGQGFGWYDELTDRAIDCHVLVFRGHRRLVQVVQSNRSEHGRQF